MNITEKIDQYLDTVDINEKLKLTGKTKDDWDKIIKVIKSINSVPQVYTAQNMIKNFVKVHGKESGHKLLELELKIQKRKVKDGKI